MKNKKNLFLIMLLISQIIESKNQILRPNPRFTINIAKQFFKARNGKIIVEIGSMRCQSNNTLNDDCEFCDDGHSTYLWLLEPNTVVFSIDINPQNTSFIKKCFANYKNLHAVTEDGIKFLKNFKEPIDLLYLDAWDVIPGTQYAEKHLEAYKAAKNKLHKNSIILIDDTDVANGGKGKLIVPNAIKDGYKLIFTGRQTMLAKY